MSSDYFWINFGDIPIKARVSLRAKYLQLLVSSQGIIELVQPLGCKTEQALPFLNAHAAWIRRQAQKLATVRQTSIYTWPKIESDAMLPLLGQANKLSIEINPALHTPAIQHDMAEKQVHLQVRSSQVNCEAILLKWLQGTALKQVAVYVEHYGQILQRLPSRIQVRQYKRRWGSLGPDDQLSLHWRLIFSPESVLKYVVLHEMCHLFYRNHGKRFYQLLAKHMPEYLAEEAWLRNQGFLLNFPIPSMDLRLKMKKDT